MKQKGYSLIEILIYMALLGIFLYSLTTLFTSSLDVKLETEANSSVEEDGRYLLNKFRYDITQADSISTPSSVGAEGTTLALVRTGVTYTYSLSGGNLIVTSGGVSDQLNSSRSTITSINFKRLGDVGGRNSITVNLTLESETQEARGKQTRTLEATYALR